MRTGRRSITILSPEPSKFQVWRLTTTLGRGKKKATPGRVPSVLREQPVKQKATTPPKRNQLTSFVESETESDEVLSSSSSSTKQEPFEPYVKEASKTDRLIEEIKQPRTKNECLQKKSNVLLEENKLLWNCRDLLLKTCAKIKNNFVSATGINLDCYMRLFNYLNARNDCRNIKFYEIYKRLSEGKYTNSEEVKSGPKPKNFCERATIRIFKLVEKCVHIFVSKPKSHCFKIYYYLDKFLIFFS